MQHRLDRTLGIFISIKFFSVISRNAFPLPPASSPTARKAGAGMPEPIIIEKESLDDLNHANRSPCLRADQSRRSISNNGFHRRCTKLGNMYRDGEPRNERETATVHRHLGAVLAKLRLRKKTDRERNHGNVARPFSEKSVERSVHRFVSFRESIHLRIRFDSIRFDYAFVISKQKRRVKYDALRIRNILSSRSTEPCDLLIARSRGSIVARPIWIREANGKGMEVPW